MKKLTTILLVLAMITTLFTGVTAAPTSQEITMDKTALTVPTPEDLAALPTLPSGSPRTTYTTSLADAAEVLREGMVQRQATVNVHICTDDWSDENLQSIAEDILIYAMIHTGGPTEGDYLLWNFTGGSVSVADDYFFEGDLIMLTYIYELEYLTTAQQEAQVDAKVSQLLADLDGTTDYEKLLALYTYVCDNVSFRDDGSDLDSTAYGALVGGYATSLGYTVTMYRLALELGLDCHTIMGTYGGAEHFWDIVQLGDDYYNIDATLDSNTEDLPYFLCCDASYPDHQRDSIFDSADFRELYPMADSDYVPPCPHDYTAETIAPTCTETGCTVYTCTLCGDSYTADTTEALGHTYGEWVKVSDPICTSDGKLERTCTGCGDVDKSYISTLGHDYEDGACTVCGKALEEGLTVPAAPAILSCYSKLQTSVKVTWTTLEDVAGYELWRSATPDDADTWSRIKTIADPTTDRYTNQGLTEGVTYYYKVRAYVTASDGSKVYSDFSSVDYMPATVVWDAPYSNATFRIRLLWEQIGGAHGYQIWRQEADGSWKIVKTLGDRDNTLTNDQGTTTAYSNTGLTAGDTHTYKMRAFRITEDGRKIFGAYSDEYTVAVKPEAPTLTVTSPKAGRAQLTWDAVNGAAGYQIWMSESPESGFKIVKSITNGDTAYTKYDLESGKTYYFKIRAYTEVNGKKTFSDYSATVSILVQ